MKRFSSAVTRKLRHYVYLYAHPQSGEVLYVGKGTGNRAFQHVAGEGQPQVAKRVRELARNGMRPKIEILAHGLPDDRTALRVEAAAIDLLGRNHLLNVVRGHESGMNGRMSVEEVSALYEARKARITDPTILIRINKLFHYGMSPVELYDATRGVWKIGPRRDRVKFAFAVYEGIVQEVYRIERWLPAGSTFSTRCPTGYRSRGRFEFVGRVADDSVRRRYLLRSVSHYFARNAQNPIAYVRVEEVSPES